MNDDVMELAKRAMHYSFIGWVLTLLMMLRLPSVEDINPDLLRQPLQTQIAQNEFHFPYEGQDIKVIPVMNYTLNGLIVSHNDPGKWYNFDLTHDSQSINTLDICVVWGSNLTNNDFHKISFHNDDWICTWSYGPDVKHVNEQEISNNHLITASDSIRKQIANLHNGDQIEIVGRLVYYGEQRWGGNMRQSSLSRADTGNGACEIIYVDSLRVLDSHNSFWAKLGDFLYWVCVLTLTFRVTVFVMPERSLHLPKWLRNWLDLYKA